MAAVGTTSKAIFWGAVAFFLLGAFTAIVAAHPYMCDRKVNPNGTTVCHGRQTLPPVGR